MQLTIARNTGYMDDQHIARFGLTPDWPTELMNSRNDNGYAVWDDLIAGSGELLAKEELMQLSARFENA